MDKKDKIYVTGHSGLVGSVLMAVLKNSGYKNIITRTSSELNLTVQEQTARFFRETQPDYVFLLAAKKGGIAANKERPVDFIYPNLMIECNVINSAYESKVRKLFFLACSMVYPKECEQPTREDYMLSGKPEPTSLSHTMAKISGIVLCQSYNTQYKMNFISAVASNIFGENDNFDPAGGHVIPSLIKRFHDAKLKNAPEVEIWGTGKPTRDFIYVGDVVDAILFLTEKYDSPELINISTGRDVSIGELAQTIKEVVGYKGKLVFDTTKPDGAPKRALDNKKISSLGWQPKTPLKEGLEKTYRWWLDNKSADES
ncbi:MAG: GDP-L-fucose synthase [Elusimicrobiota bacterium]